MHPYMGWSHNTNIHVHVHVYIDNITDYILSNSLFTFFRMSLAKVSNASSMLAFVFADVSRKGIFCCCPNCSPLSLGTTLRPSISDLLPTNNLSTSGEAC